MAIYANYSPKHFVVLYLFYTFVKPLQHKTNIQSMNMKKMLLPLLTLLFCVQAFTQTYKTEFTYDNAGNRVSRKVIVLNNVQSRAADPEPDSPLQDELSKRKITIHPNPTRGMLTVELSGGQQEDMHKVQVYTSGGQLIISEAITGNGSLGADLSAYLPGIYLLLVSTGKEQAQYKIIKQ